jgi:hypothetical protein
LLKTSQGREAAVEGFVTDMKPTDWIVAFAALAALAGVVVLLVQVNCLSRQVKLLHFADYAMRHQAIVLGLPEDIDRPGFALDELPDYEDAMHRMRAYFDLSFEKWSLARQRQIHPDIWRMWKSRITATLAKPAFQQAWDIIKADARFEPDFAGFVDQCIHYPGSRLAA